MTTFCIKLYNRLILLMHTSDVFLSLTYCSLCCCNFSIFFCSSSWSRRMLLSCGCCAVGKHTHASALELEILIKIAIINAVLSKHLQTVTTCHRNYTVPRTRTKFSDRAFSAAGRVIWNYIPESIWALNNVHTFKRLLKMHFLKQT